MSSALVDIKSGPQSVRVSSGPLVRSILRLEPLDRLGQSIRGDFRLAYRAGHEIKVEGNSRMPYALFVNELRAPRPQLAGSPKNLLNFVTVLPYSPKCQR